MKDLMLTGAGRSQLVQKESLLAQMVGALQGGVALVQPVANLFGGFLAVPVQAAVDAALGIARTLSTTGITLLLSEQRSALGLQISGAAQTLALDVATALSRCPPVEAATGVTGAGLERQLQQEDELVSLRKALYLVVDLVDDARLLLQGWQFEAQRRLMAALFTEFIKAGTAAERVQIVADASTALEPLEAQLAAQRATRADNASKTAVQAEELVALENDLVMVQTMRALREDQPVDEDLLRRMAIHYEARLPRAGAVPAAAPRPRAAVKTRVKKPTPPLP